MYNETWLCAHACAHTNERTHAYTHTQTNAHAHTHTLSTHFVSLSLPCLKKQHTIGNFLAVQWLGIGDPASQTMRPKNIYIQYSICTFVHLHFFHLSNIYPDDLFMVNIQIPYSSFFCNGVLLQRGCCFFNQSHLCGHFQSFAVYKHCFNKYTSFCILGTESQKWGCQVKR